MLDVLGVFSWFWCSRLGSTAWGLNPTHFRGIPPPPLLAGEMSLWTFSWHLWEHSQPSCASSTLPTYLDVVMWLLLSVHGHKVSFQLVLNLGGFLYNSVVIPVLSWEEVNVACTYSSAFLGLRIYGNTFKKRINYISEYSLSELGRLAAQDRHVLGRPSTDTPSYLQFPQSSRLYCQQGKWNLFRNIYIPEYIYIHWSFDILLWIRSQRPI